MTFHDHWTPLRYDYDEFTRGLAEKLQARMDSADEQDNEDVAGAMRRTAIGIYENWRHAAIENHALKPKDDARFRRILKLSDA